MKYGPLIISGFLLAGCSFVNAFDDVSEGAAGAAGVSAAGGTSGAGAGGSAGVGAGGSAGVGAGGSAGVGAGGSGAGGSGAGGSGGTAGSQGGSPLGLRCESNVDCESADGDHLSCLTAVQGPPHGLCTRLCVNDGECGAEGVCESGVCALSCTWGGVEADKCRSRPEFGCVPTMSGGDYVPSRSVCVARCRNHSECGPAYCDYQTGLCRGTEPTGAQLGTNCSSGTDCQGACRRVGGNGRCAQHCTLGDYGLGACGSGLSTPQAAACVGPPLSPAGIPTPNLGDGLGECYQLCDCTTGCRGSSDTCYKLEDLATGGPVSEWGRAGVCIPSWISVTADPLSCP